MRALLCALLLAPLASLAAQASGNDAAPAAASIDPKVAAVLAELDAKVAALTSYRMTMETTSSSAGMPGMTNDMKMTSTAEWKKVGESYRYRADSTVDSTMVFNGATTKDTSKSLMVVDGKHAWSQNEMAGTVSVVKSDMQSTLESRPSRIIEQMATDCDVTLGEDKEIGGAKCAVIEMKTKKKEGAIEGSYAMAFDRATGLMREQIIRDAEGKPTTHTTITKVEVGVDLPDSLFTYTPPEGSTLMDMTTGGSGGK